MKLTRRLLLFLLCVCLLMTLGAASAASARVVFSASEPDADGLFTVSVTVYDATFEGFQFALTYNKVVISPASWTTGRLTVVDSEYIRKETAVQAISVYGGISGDQTGMTILGYSQDDPDFSVSAGANGTVLLSIRFKVVGQGASGLRVSEGENGNGLAYEYKMIPTVFVFDLPVELNGGTSSSSDVTEPVMTKTERAKNTIILQIGNYAAAKDGALCHIYPGEKQVTPYIKDDDSGNGRTMVPLRFIAEKLGASVDWADDGAQTVIITLGANTVVMTIGSTDYKVNGMTKIMDAAPEIKDNGDGSSDGRTMVPMRFLIEALGKPVYWDITSKLVIVTEPDTPWQADRNAEQELTSDVLLIISPLLRDLVK